MTIWLLLSLVSTNNISASQENEYSYIFPKPTTAGMKTTTEFLFVQNLSREQPWTCCTYVKTEENCNPKLVNKNVQKTQKINPLTR